jgi:hypothetical protein
VKVAVDCLWPGVDTEAGHTREKSDAIHGEWSVLEGVERNDNEPRKRGNVARRRNVPREKQSRGQQLRKKRRYAGKNT